MNIIKKIKFKFKLWKICLVARILATAEQKKEVQFIISELNYTDEPRRKIRLLELLAKEVLH